MILKSWCDPYPEQISYLSICTIPPKNGTKYEVYVYSCVCATSMLVIAVLSAGVWHECRHIIYDPSHSRHCVEDRARTDTKYKVLYFLVPSLSFGIRGKKKNTFCCV